MHNLTQLSLKMSVLILIGLTSLNAAAITANQTAMALANNLIGPGITLISATYTGDPTIQNGTFTAGGNAAVGIGFDSGVVLSSGNVNQIPGPNVIATPETLGVATTPFGNDLLNTIVPSPGDVDLNTLVPGSMTNDASVLTLTFSTAVAGNLSFNYVFASEEYINFVGSRFNDVFGFFLDGVNIGLVGGQPITVNNINPVTNAALYRNNVANTNGFSNLGLNVKFDGLTTVLTATKMNLPAGQHTIKFAVADTNDAKLDSAVFLQAGSFTIGPAPVMSPPTLTKAFGAPSVALNGSTTLTFTVSNTGVGATALDGIAFTDPLPAGVVVSAGNVTTTNCPGAPTITAVALSSNFTLAGLSLPINGTCAITVNVTGTVAGVMTNTTSPITSTTNASTGTAAMAMLSVATSPGLTKIFGAPSMLLGGTTTLTLTLSNPDLKTALTGVGFIDPLPAGLVIATPNGLTGTCVGLPGANIVATAGGTSVTVSGLTLAATSLCSVTVNVTGVATGIQNNTTNAPTSANGGTGMAATAAIRIDPLPFIAPDGVFQVRYASNLTMGDSVINLSNTGQSSTTALPLQDGNLCVNVYAFSPDEQLISCCSCYVTPDGLVSLSARNDLASNTLTPGNPTSIVVKLLSSAATTPTACNASTAGTLANPLATGLTAFGTTIHALPITPASPATTFGATETPFVRATLSFAELTRLTSLCGFIQATGSGFGICKTCRLGGQGAIRE